MSQLPTKADILDWISQNPTLTAKRDIAKAFGIKGAARIDLKRLLRELEDEGHLEKRKRSYQDPDRLPPVSVLLVAGTDSDGELLAKPMEWQGEGIEPIVLIVRRAADPALGEGDRILARLTLVKGEAYHYEARLIRRIGANPKKLLGVFRKSAEGGRIVPIDKGVETEWLVRTVDMQGARDGELVEAERAGPKNRMGLPRARIVGRLGDPSGARAVSLIAIHQHNIPDQFPDAVIAEADKARPTGLAGREDFRDMPLVTIDPSDARDHDDACYAHADQDPKNIGGHVIWVAIADVAAYVHPGSALDREARTRGNSTYFPDRVVPMLPDRLSGDLCSLHQGVPRPCIAVRMQLDPQGEKIGHSFHRGLMRSPASLTYEEVQQAMDSAPNERTRDLLEPVLHPLYAAYNALCEARTRRQPLELDLPERRIELDDNGAVTSVRFKDRLEAHRLIEEFMVLANVCAAETLLARRVPLLFRVHEEPTKEKMDALRETARASGFNLAKGQVLRTAHLNRLLREAEGTDTAEVINLSTLRSMTQAYYAPENLGHFGLSLPKYTHFTSPIRRYADLVVHRALIAAHEWGDEGLHPEEYGDLESIGAHISLTERRSMVAERDTTDRYLAAYLSERVGSEFTGRVSGLARFGLFVKLAQSGADGLVPMRAIGNEYFHFDREQNTLMGVDSGLTIGLGQRVTVRLTEAAALTGGIALELLEVDGVNLPRGDRAGAPRAAPRRRLAKARKKAAKAKRKVSRARRS
ncbi:MAG: ribonuclease R [Pseudomonadota bacterium]